MNCTSASLCALLLATPLVASLTPEEPQPAAAALVSEGPSFWRLAWDDSLDAELEDLDKQCAVRLNRIDGSLTGSFVGGVLGQERLAVFTGELAGADGSGLLILQQREPGYTCSYQLQNVSSTLWRGTWLDTRGGSGTVELVSTTSHHRRSTSQSPRVY